MTIYYTLISVSRLRYQCLVRWFAVMVNSQSVDILLGRIHVNLSTLTSAVGPVPAHSTVTSPDTGSTSYCWSVNTTLHCGMSAGELK